MESQAGKDAATCVMWVVVSFALFCVFFIGVMSIVLTDDGAIQWGEGWQALKTFLGV